MKADLTPPWQPLTVRFQAWWRRLSPNRQDRVAVFAPLIAVLLFLVAVLASFSYLKYEESVRDFELLQRDVEYAQQRLRLRLMERQERIMRLGTDLAHGPMSGRRFQDDARQLMEDSPEIASLTWLDSRGRVVASQHSPSVNNSEVTFTPGQSLRQPGMATLFNLARDLMQPTYSQPVRRVNPDKTAPTEAWLQLQVPIQNQGRFQGMLLTLYSVDSLFRYGVPREVIEKHAISLRDVNRDVLVGHSANRSLRLSSWLPWLELNEDYSVPIMPVGYSLSLHAQPYRTSQGLIGNSLKWFVVTLSGITTWLLLASWRHTRRRIQAQQALVAETNFRRAMENSMLTGMRALDMNGRITYVNAAFCQMTGWAESDLVGCMPPYPYWPDDDREMLQDRLSDELAGKTAQEGFQVRVKRKNGTIFDARLYVSPLVDARGTQTGWMTSMTDITEPNRIRDQLSAAHARFTTVLEALDASVSVAPLGSAELLFANNRYRQWFGQDAQGHLDLVVQAGKPSQGGDDARHEDVLAGFPTEELTTSESENAEILQPQLNKWLEVRTRYLNWVDGRLAQMVIATDITPRRRAEEQAALQAERAQSASRLVTMGEMASSVAHELNQPLTAINNYCNGMLSRLKADNLAQEELLKALEKTAHQAQRAGQIIHRIRSFVKRSEPNRLPSDVGTMVGEAVELAGIEMRRRQVQLTQHLASHLPPIHADPILIEQVLINLLKNAAESIDQANRPAGQRLVELKVLARPLGDQTVVEFSVSDTGKGLPPEVMEHLFEAFFSTKREGMGIGLNLCRSIVESHRGRMHAENLYNGGSVAGCRFSFWLPVHGHSDSETRGPHPHAGATA